MSGPNPLAVLVSILRTRRTRRPQPAGTATVDHRAIEPILATVAAGGVAALSEYTVERYLAAMSRVDPDTLGRDEALAFWLNTYNAAALALTRRAFNRDVGTVLRVPGAFATPVAEVAGEALSLDDIEHGKIRRFGDPRIHAALVCGSVSCPTLRFEPYHGERLNAQLDDQMRHFLAAGAAMVLAESPTVALSRVFRWYGADFVRPHRMPTLLPASKGSILRAVAAWLDPETANWVGRAKPSVVFQEYDWALGCRVRDPAGPNKHAPPAESLSRGVSHRPPDLQSDISDPGLTERSAAEEYRTRKERHE